MTQRQPVASASPNIAEEQQQKLRQLFPEVFNEGKIDFERLRATLGDLVDDSPERYSFGWAGKRDAIRLLQMPTRATLVPDRAESVNFDETQHVFIEGDNLEVLKLLYKPYFGRIKLIYIDPPYNTGNDFIYSDNYADPLATYLKLTQQQDEAGNLLVSNPESSGRYHSAWLSMMYPRLFLARQLLREDGAIFISIDDNELHDLRLMMNEIFGEENFIATIIWQKVFAPKNTAKHFSDDHDYILVYARNKEIWRPQLLARSEDALSRYQNLDDDPRGLWSSSDLAARNYYRKGEYEVTSPSGKKFKNPIGAYWRVSYEKFLELDKDGRIWWGEDGGNMPRLKRFLSEVQQGVVPQTLWTYKEVGHTQEAKRELLKHVSFQESQNVLNTLKPPRLLQRILQIATEVDTQDIVLDFFAGSASTAHAVLAQNVADSGNRRFIMVQFPEPLPKPEPNLKTIADMGKQRIRSVIREQQAADEGKFEFAQDGRLAALGFKVFKLAASNMRLWTGVKDLEPAAYMQQMAMFTNPLRADWEVANVIYEVALREGFDLNSRIEPVTLEMDNTIYRVTDPDKDQFFHICLDNQLAPDPTYQLGLSKTDLFICRDIALNDTTAANIALNCRLKTI